MRVIKIAIITLGCKVNQYESHTFENYFHTKGYQIVESKEPADIVIINTCAVTVQAARKSRQHIRQSRRLNSEAFIIIMGCLSQQYDFSEDLFQIGDVFLGSANKSVVCDVVDSYVAGTWDVSLKNQVKPFSNDVSYEEMPASPIGHRVRAEVKVQDGCEQFCNYCIIPYLRGPERSRTPDRVVQEIRELCEHGFQEVVLTGIHLGSYGRDFSPQQSLTGLTKRILQETSIKRLRLSSIEPNDLSSELLELIASEERIARHLHIPLQGGSDDLLKAMNRHYLTSDYRALLARIRLFDPLIAITTDLIVGFPGETEEEFERTLNFVGEMKFSAMHVFRFSPRPGTPAAKMPDQINGNTSHERSSRIQEQARKQSLLYHQTMIGNEYQVLIERCKPKCAEGHSSNYVKVVVQGQGLVKNMMVNVKIISCDAYSTTGVVV